MSNAAIHNFRRGGFTILRRFLSAGTCDKIINELDRLWADQSNETRPRRGGLRNLLRSSAAVRAVATDSALRTILRDVLGGDPFPVRSIFFDKTAEANWAVAWHQDLHIAVAERNETPGFGPWSVKAGVVHVQPPAEILSRIITVRLHLDDCDGTNGALRVIPGSHTNGVLSDFQLATWRQREAITCCVPKGGLLLMCPLLLHASSAATQPGHRRVLHLEYACEQLPGGLRWHEWHSAQSGSRHNETVDSNETI